MAKYRQVNTNFWDDNYIVGLAPDRMLLFLYFLTNSLCDLSGVYEISLSRIVFDTKMPQVKVEKALGEFEAAGKIVYKFGWLVIINFIKHQSRHPNTQKGIQRSLEQAPQWAKDLLPDYPGAPADMDTEDPDVKKVFARWQTDHSFPTAILDIRRADLIRTQLKNFTVEQLCSASRGATFDPWLMGTHQNSEKKFNNIDTIFRDAGKVEELIELAGEAW